MVMVVLSVVVDMSPDVGLLMLLEGGAVDGDEVCRRRRRGGHRVGGVHPSADSQTDLEGVQLCHNAEFEVLLLLLALLLARSLFTRNSAPSLGVGGARKYAGSCCSHSTCSLLPSSRALPPSLLCISSPHALSLDTARRRRAHTSD